MAKDSEVVVGQGSEQSPESVGVLVRDLAKSYMDNQVKGAILRGAYPWAMSIYSVLLFYWGYNLGAG